MTHNAFLIPSERSGPTGTILEFVERDMVDARQARHRNRTFLEPVMDLSRFRPNACIDYVVLSVKTARTTGFNHIRDILEAPCNSAKPFVDPKDGSANSATLFHISVQNPSIRMLLEIDQVLKGAGFGLAQPVELHALEVSVDFYPKTGDATDRELMVGILQRTYGAKFGAWTDNDMRPRFCYSDAGVAGTTKTEHIFPLDRPDLSAVIDCSLVRQPRLDSTMYFGRQEGSVLVRIQNKISDCRKGSVAVALKDKDKRARVEVYISGEELLKRNLRGIDDLARFNFTSLQGDFFHFALPTFRTTSAFKSSSPVRVAMNAIRREQFLLTGVSGLQQVDRLRDLWFNDQVHHRASHRQQLDAHLKEAGRLSACRKVGKGVQGDRFAYVELNRMVSEALRNLQKKSLRGRP